MAKKTYPKGIYANRSDKAPGFVRSNVKIDNAKAIEFLQAQTTPFTHLTICEGQEPDKYGNLDYICVDDYKMELEAKKAQEGFNSARQSAQPKPQLQKTPADQFEDDIPF